MSDWVEWSVDLVGGDRLEEQRAGLGPGGGGGGRDDDAGAGPALDQAGDLLVAVGADPGDVGVDDAGSGAAAEGHALGGGQLAGRGRVVGGEQPQPERGPAAQLLVALPGGGVEVELVRSAGADPGGGHGVRVAADRP